MFLRVIPVVALAALIVGPAVAQVAKDKKGPPPKANPQQVAAAEKTLTEFTCKLHRDDKATGVPVDLVWFPQKTTDKDVTRLVPVAARLPGLKMIDLGETEVTDAAMKDVAKLTNLEAVYLDRTRVTDDGVKALAELPRLAWLDLSRTKVSAKSTNTLAGMKSLRHLFVDGQCSTADVEKLATLNRLQSLQVRPSEPDAAMNHIGKLDDLKELRIPALCGDGFNQIAKLSKLETVQLRGGLETTPADGWKVLVNLPKLQALDLSFFARNDWDNYGRLKRSRQDSKPKSRPLAPTAEGLANLTGLKKLDLTGTPVGNDVLKQVGKLSGLEELTLCCTMVSLEGAKDLSELTKLRYLNVRNAQVTNAGLRSLEPLKSLEQILLYDNLVTEDGVNRLQKALPRTQILWKYTKEPGAHYWRVPSGGYPGG